MENVNVFDPKSLPIKQIFGNADSLYKIPRYQRPYKWEDEQIDKLWDDILEAYQNQEDYYFLGSIILAKSNEPTDLYWDVVDGQQRLTTLVILFKVVLEIYPNINKEDSSENPAVINEFILKDSIFYQGTFKRIKLFTHPHHQGEFDKIIIYGNASSWVRPYKYQIHLDESPSFKFINTASSFKEKLLLIGEEEAGKLINYLYNSVYLIRINCSSREFAIRMFQVINDRGLDLTSADLIKSYLMEMIDNNNREDREMQKQKEEIFIADWQALELMINDFDIDINELLFIYGYYLLEQNPKKSIYEELVKQFKNKDPNDIMQDFKAFAELYKNHIRNMMDNSMHGYWYLRWNVFWKSILIAALHTKYKEYERLKKLLLRFYYLYWIGGYTLSKIKHISYSLIKWVKEKKAINEIENELNNKIIDDSVIKYIVDNLNSDNVYNTPWIKPLLLLIEYNQTDSNLPFIELSKELHIEHVLPHEYQNITEWTDEFNEEFAKKWLDRAGNLTLLFGSKNISASNNPFNKKINVYKGKGLYEDQDNRITVFNITQKIVNDYNSNIYNKKWNKKAIEDRWNWFCKEVEKLLHISLNEIYINE